MPSSSTAVQSHTQSAQHDLDQPFTKETAPESQNLCRSSSNEDARGLHQNPANLCVTKICESAHECHQTIPGSTTLSSILQANISNCCKQLGTLCHRPCPTFEFVVCSCMPTMYTTTLRMITRFTHNQVKDNGDANTEVPSLLVPWKTTLCSPPISQDTPIYIF